MTENHWLARGIAIFGEGNPTILELDVRRPHPLIPFVAPNWPR